MRAYLRGPSLGPLHTTIWSSRRRHRRAPGRVTAGQVLAFAVALAVVIAYVIVRS